MLTGMIGAILGVLLVLPVFIVSYRKGAKQLAFIYLLLGGVVGFILGRQLIIEIADGVI